MIRAFVPMLLSLALLAPAVARADEEQETRLRARLGAEAAAPVVEVVRAAAAQGLPTSSLVARALEGASRRADGAAILAAVRRQATGLAAARRALGAAARPAELEAGASALLAGVPEDSIASLRRARPGGSLVIPLVVIADFVARGVPMESASGTVIVAARAGAPDPALLRMRERIHQRISRGEAPLGASREGLRELLSKSSTGNVNEKSPPREPPPRRRP